MKRYDTIPVALARTNLFEEMLTRFGQVLSSHKWINCKFIYEVDEDNAIIFRDRLSCTKFEKSYTDEKITFDDIWLDGNVSGNLLIENSTSDIVEEQFILEKPDWRLVLKCPIDIIEDKDHKNITAIYLLRKKN